MADFEKGIRATWVLGLIGDFRFDSENVRCRACGETLGVHYCEDKVYVVRCKKCKTLTIVKAKNPREAARIVGKDYYYIDRGAKKELFADVAERMVYPRDQCLVEMTRGRCFVPYVAPRQMGAPESEADHAE